MTILTPTPEEYAAKMIAATLSFERDELSAMTYRDIGAVLVRRLNEVGIDVVYNDKWGDGE